MPYALFDRGEQIGKHQPPELEVWKQTLKAGLISAAGAGDLVVWFLLGETKPAKYAEPNYAE